MATIEHIKDFRLNHLLGQGLRAALVAKGLDQREKNHRQLNYRQRTSPHVLGREKINRGNPGFIASIPLGNSHLEPSLYQKSFKLTDVFCFSFSASWLAAGSGNQILLYNRQTQQFSTFSHPWFTQIHTIYFSRGEDKLLISSTGFDAIFEIDICSGKTLWNWFAWEHGYSQSLLGHYYTRQKEVSDHLSAQGQTVTLVNNPALFVGEGIPTRFIPVHLNSACYDQTEGKILTTFFHQGIGLAIDKKTGASTKIVEGLKCPHRLEQTADDCFVVTSSRQGHIIRINLAKQEYQTFSFEGLPGIVRDKQLTEYIQNTAVLGESLFAAVDIHRSTIWLIDILEKTYRGIKYPLEWSVHDLVLIDEDIAVDINRMSELNHQEG